MTLRNTSSLRSKRSPTKRTKFHISSRAKNEVGAKRWKEGDGGEERRERLPANPLILKNAHWFSRLSSLTD